MYRVKHRTCPAVFLAFFLVVTPSAALTPRSVGGRVTTDARTGAPEAARVELQGVTDAYAWGRQILAGRARAEPVARAAVTASGRFVVEVPEEHAVAVALAAVEVSAPGFVPMRYDPLPLLEPVELPDVALTRDVGAPIEVRTVSGDAAVGVWVLAESVPLGGFKGGRGSAAPKFWDDRAINGWRPGSRLDKTDKQGRLVLPRAAGEELRIHAFAGGRTATGTIGDGGAPSLVLNLEPTAPERRIEIVGEDDEPLARVLVSAGDPAWPAVMTDAEGRASLRLDATQSAELRLHAHDGRTRRAVLALPTGEDDRLVLAAPVVFSGHVVDRARGRPLAGALVWQGRDPGSFTSTDARGAYAVVGRSGEPFWLQAHAAGFLPRRGWVRRADTHARQAPSLALEAAGRTGGRVVDTDGAPLADAALELMALSREDFFRMDRAASRAVTDVRGRFELRGLRPEAAYELQASRPGYLTDRRTIGAEGGEAWRITLKKARPAFGRVIDDHDRPLAGVRVLLRPTGVAQARPEDVTAVTSDAQGLFRIAAAPASRVDIEARKSGFAPLLVPGVQVLAGPGDADLGTLVLAPGARIEGRVRGPDDKPIAGAGIWWIEDLGRPARGAADHVRQQEAAARSADDGLFVLEDLKPGQRLHLLVGREGYLPAWALGVVAPAEELVAVVLEKAFGVRGRVVDEDGEPVTRARVTLAARGPAPGTLGVESAGQASRMTASDARGEFVLDEVAAGKVELTAAAEGFLPSAPYPLVVTPDAEALEDVLLVLRRGAVVEGRVTNQGGEGVDGAELRIRFAATRSDLDGFFRLGGVPLGYQALQVRHPEYDRLLQEVHVEAGVNPAHPVLADGWHVAGQVVDEAGTPLAGTHVELRRRASRGGRYEAVSGAEGRFRVAAVAPGRYDLLASQAGFAPTEMKDACALTAGSVEDLLVVLRPGATVAGRILGLELAELATVRLEAERDGGTTRPGTVDYEGRFRIDHLEAGDWQLRAALAEGRRQAEALFTVDAGIREVEQDLEFTGGLTLSGRALYEGEPLVAAYVDLNGHDLAVKRSVMTDRDGGFRIEDLEPGRYRIDLAAPDRTLTYVEDLELTTDEEIVLEIATVRVSGTVRSAATGEPLADALVYMQKFLGPGASEPGPLTTLATGPEGSFTMARLTPGRYQLTVRKNGYAPVERWLDADPGRVPAPLELELEETEGLTLLLIPPASGELPQLAAVSVFDDAGRGVISDARQPTDAGWVRFPLVPAGTWTILVSAAGTAPAWITATVPGPTLQLDLAPAAPLTVRVPVLMESNLTASLTILGGDGGRFRGAAPGGAVQDQWSLNGGRGIVDNIPAGVWTLQAVATDGRSWTGSVVTNGQAETVLTLE